MYGIYRIGKNLFVRPHERDKLAIKKYSALGTVSEKLHSACPKTPFIWGRMTKKTTNRMFSLTWPSFWHDVTADIGVQHSKMAAAMFV